MIPLKVPALQECSMSTVISNCKGRREAQKGMGWGEADDSDF